MHDYDLWLSTNPADYPEHGSCSVCDYPLSFDEDEDGKHIWCPYCYAESDILHTLNKMRKIAAMPLLTVRQLDTSLVTGLREVAEEHNDTSLERACALWLDRNGG